MKLLIATANVINNKFDENVNIDWINKIDVARRVDTIDSPKPFAPIPLYYFNENLRNDAHTIYWLTSPLHNWLIENSVYDYKLTCEIRTASTKCDLPVISLDPYKVEIFVELERNIAVLFKLACL